MDILNAGNVVKSKTSDKLMIINRRETNKPAFNKEVLNHVFDKEVNEKDVYVYVCFVEEPDGRVKKLEFKRDELIFVRDKF